MIRRRHPDSEYAFESFRGLYNADGIPQLSSGVIVTLGFWGGRSQMAAEFLRVHVLDSLEDGTFGGVLIDDPLHCTSLRKHDYVRGFSEAHVRTLIVVE